MKDKQMLFSMIDSLSPNDLEAVYQYAKQRRQVVSFHKASGTHPGVIDTSEREPAETIRAEVNAMIDDTIKAIRQKRETQEAKVVSEDYAVAGKR